MPRVTLRASACGYTYVEMLAALALVGFAVLATGGLTAHARRSQRAVEEHARAAHAVANEIERRLALGPRDQPVGSHRWLTAGEAASGLPGACGLVEVAVDPATRLHRVTVVLEWGDGRRVVHEVLQ